MRLENALSFQESSSSLKEFHQVFKALFQLKKMSEQSPHENIESLKADNASIDKEDQLNQNSFPIKDPMIVDDKEEIQPTQETADHSQRQTQSNLIIIEVERKFQDSKDVILDMIHEITHLQVRFFLRVNGLTK